MGLPSGMLSAAILNGTPSRGAGCRSEFPRRIACLMFCRDHGTAIYIDSSPPQRKYMKTECTPAEIAASWRGYHGIPPASLRTEVTPRESSEKICRSGDGTAHSCRARGQRGKSPPDRGPAPAPAGSIIDDPEASPNDRYVARDLPAEKECIAAGAGADDGQGTRHRGSSWASAGAMVGAVLTRRARRGHLARCVLDVQPAQLRYSQLATAETCGGEERTRQQPADAQIEFSCRGPRAASTSSADGKGGGSAQQNRPVQRPRRC